MITANTTTTAPVLTEAQQTEYFSTQSPLAQPLSPLDWLAQQNNTSQPTGISASSMPQDDIDRAAAKKSAISNFNEGTSQAISPVSSTPTLDTVQNSFLSMMTENNQEAMSMSQQNFQDSMRSINRIYDNELARADYQYGELMGNLVREQKKANDVATANAIALNPYSQSRGAQTAANFTNAINMEYQRQAENITAKYRMAQEAIAAGQADVAMKLKQSAQRDMMETQQNFQAGLMNLYKESKQQHQFDIKQQSQYQDDFVERLSLLGPDAAVQDFSSLFELGKKMGLNENEVRQYVGSAIKERGMEVDEAEFDKAYKMQQLKNAELQNVKLTQDIYKSGSGGDKIYDLKNIPGELRSSIFEDLSDPEVVKSLGDDSQQVIQKLASAYPEVQLEALEYFVNTYYDYDAITGEESADPWWKIW